MASYDEILGQVPLQQLAGQLGVDESEVEQAARTALPALLGGLQANAQDPAGAQSLASALSDHQGRRWAASPTSTSRTARGSSATSSATTPTRW